MPVSRESVVLKLFQAATVLTLGNGESTFFWTDVWLDGRCIEDIAPSIFATVSARKKKTVVAQALAGDAWWWLTAKQQLPKLLRRGFDSLFFLVGWLIWKERNARTFNGVGRPAADLAALIQDEASSWCQAGFTHFRLLLSVLGA
ncbi:unnamed protein product [Miscanthus lutarioriparius]|uniref:Uncharacterized protein n=1 Tax=Miscanthus lutarioriparius TaxID=422564 RepID=A0A811RE80_9POAL|nr:unnamed protein product [Miscanthus lutarioriparius]